MSATNELLHNGRYRIDRQFDHNTGNVFDAYDTVRDTKVIIKEIVLKTNKVMTAAQLESMKAAFDEHAKALSSMRHESLSRVEDHFVDTDRQYLVLEPADGDDLESVAESSNGPLELEKVLAWTDQVLDGLNYLHSQFPPVVHKRLSPANIKIDASGNAKVHSFGVADESASFVNTAITSNAAEAAQINYSPLEQLWDGLDSASQKVIANSYDDRAERILKEPADARTDIYGVGATIYRLITGRVPIDALERSIELLDGNSDPLVSPDKLNNAVPVEISDIVMKAMEIRRENRFDTAAIMRQVLRTAILKIEEREAEERREQEEAAADLARASEIRAEQVQKMHDEKASEAEAEKQRGAELLAKKLQEAEEQRLAAEKRAAEVERLLMEKEAEAARLAALAAPQDVADDLLELHETPSSLPLETTRTKVVSGDQSFTKFKNAASEPETESVIVEKVTDRPDIAAFSDVVEAAASFEPPPAAPNPDRSDNDYDVDLYPAPAASTFPIAIVGGGAALLLMVVVGIWFMMSGSSSSDQQATTPAAQQPAPAQQQPAEQAFTAPSNTTDANTQQAADAAIVTDETAKPDAAVRTAAAERKPQPQAAKPAPEKKKVTVDDLINDL